MFDDWRDQDQVGVSIWCEFSESEDHIVPYPNDSEDSTLFCFGNHSKKQRNGEVNFVAKPIEETSEINNDFPACNLDISSACNTNKKLSSPRLDMDTWPDLPALSASFINGYNDNNDRDTMTTQLLNDFSVESKMNKVRRNMTDYDHSSAVFHCKDSSALNGSFSFSADGAVQLDGEPELFGSDQKDEGNDSFIGPDWANIGDFDDLDKIFRYDSIFGHDIIGNGDEFLSSSTDVISSTVQSIPIPEITISMDDSSDQGCPSFQFVEHYSAKRMPEEKKADSSVRTGDQTVCQTHLINEYQEANNQLSGREDTQKKLSGSRKKADEKNKNNSSQNFNDVCSDNINHSQLFMSPKMHPSIKLEKSQPPTISQQMQLCDVKPMEHVGSSNQYMFSGYGYSTCHFPAFPHTERTPIKPLAGGRNIPDSLKHSHYSVQVPDVLSRSQTMTPQEKIEKLRRHQQMQAMVAIQQEQQQFDHQIAVSDNILHASCQNAVACTTGVEGCAVKFLSPDQSSVVEHDDSQITPSIDDHSLEETIYYQLQDTLRKLDTRVRLCIRDSLFRLAKSAVERQSASDRSSAKGCSKDEGEVPANEIFNSKSRCTGMTDGEADTNPIDRTMAHLLFYRPSGLCARPEKGEISQSSMSCNPVTTSRRVN